MNRMEPRFAVDGRGPRRVMFYSHDTYGLGHLRRTLSLARFLRHARPHLSQLIVTGSPMAHRFPLPPDADYIKLPSVVKVGSERYEPRSLAMPFTAVRDLRRELLLDAARHFRPDVLVVDNVPAGLKGELTATLRDLKAGSCRLVLGLRDVVDEPAWVRRNWARTGSYALLDDVYDRILIYGRRDVYDPVAQYGFSERAAAKTRFVGYLGREPPARTPEEVRGELDLDGERLVLVMAGGGGDGYQLLRAALETIRLRGGDVPFSILLVGGPLMPRRDQRRVRELVATQPRVRYFDFTEDLASYLAAADVVISMGGYNSVCELLSAGKPAIVVPRVVPRREQLIRAEALSRRGLLRLVHPDRLAPAVLCEEMERLLDEHGRDRPRLPLDGLAGAAAALDELLRSSTTPRVALGA
jgi:predicted glycosyltransferase